MELLQMKYFTAAVQEGSISGAAKKLGMTQPPLSVQLKLLEKELGAKLFVRGSRKISLTEEGKVFYDHAVRILNMTESASTAVAGCRHAETGTLRIGVVSSLIDVSVKRWFSGFSALHPFVNYELTEGTTYEVLDLLSGHLLDVVLVRTPFSARGFECLSLEPEDMLLIGKERYLKPFPEKVSLKQASQLPLTVYRRWAGVLDRAFAAKGYRPRLFCVADDARTCISWAAEGMGVAIAPSDITQIRNFSGLKLCTRIIRDLLPAAQTTIAVNEGGCDTAVGREFTEYFRKNCG
jgi:DNA-binding transcriptional LysR family regulator